MRIVREDIEPEISQAYYEQVKNMSSKVISLSDELGREIDSWLIEASEYVSRILPEDRQKILEVISQVEALVSDKLTKYKDIFSKK